MALISNPPKQTAGSLRVKAGQLTRRSRARTHTGTLQLEPRWLKADFLLKPADGDPNAYFKAGDLLREDGRYSFRLNINNKQYGEYQFVVKGGRIELQGKQIKENTDPMVYIVDYLSGGRYTSWWIKRN